MRRTPRAFAIPVAVGVLLGTAIPTTSGIAGAEPVSPDSVGSLVAAIANVNQKLQDLGASVQAQQESVNKAIVEVQNARDNAAAAQQEVDASARAVHDADAAITAAQKRFDTFAASTYVNGPSSSYLTAADPADMIDTASAGQTLAASAQQVVADLQRARTEQVNKESAARLAKQKADQAAVDAQSSQDAAVEALKSAQQTFKDQQGQLSELTAQRNAAQAKLAEARTWSASASSQPKPAAPQANSSSNWDRVPGAPAPAGANWDTSLWDPTLPAIPSAFVSGDPIAIINTVLGISSTSAQYTADMGRNFLRKMGILPTPSGYTNGAIPRVYGRQASEYVIQRAMSQIGVPYSWGGGNAAGKSVGIDSGSNTVGFDCSGLILYAFAGVGIKLPHYSGAQYDMGRKIPSSQMRRGDVIFYGPGGSQHVTLYLGNGQMLEAPYTGSHVKVSPVRTSGMTPYVVRYIEF
ncbi:NlpC/P60 family peptidoglycan endopeptidase RipA [Mycobacterium sp. 1274761.0]|uniref:NlpC/P60 family peptidoglycan endopeptidase RipA n=1 Tax=Mycobacterium sp. 1274761.0 TaxID=1834077 RepID=UPI0007FFDA57|nr:NlpC/P60 family peptidoglycan endopeptidase RipA [Mycobacterium sp. 1274761.0]OBK70357.1 peptidase M23 [Mycobacterium sp. 1274761.0]